MGDSVPKGWRKEVLGNLCDVNRGSSPRPIADQRFFKGGTIPWIKIADATKSGKHLYETKEHVNEFGASFSRQLTKGSLIIAASGTLGYPQFLGVEGCAHDGWLIPSNFRGIDKNFLYYLFLWKKEFFYSSAYGAAIQNINTMILREMEVVIPDMQGQERIAAVLSAYDDLIENNTRRMLVLERMAQALYREWFVHFRFPGHAQVKLVASPLGKIPQGWEVTTLQSITTKIGSGATPRGGKDTYKAEGIHLIRSLNIYDYSFEFDNLAFIDEKQAAELDNVTVEENDILLNITGASVARCALVPSYLLPARVNQHVAIIRTDATMASPFYVLDTINSDQRKQQLLALAQGGATREALTKETVSNFEIILPPTPLLKRYDDIAKSIHKQREVLLRKNQNLRHTRDLLLPKLISGALDVSKLDIETT